MRRVNVVEIEFSNMIHLYYGVYRRTRTAAARLTPNCLCERAIYTE